MGSFGHPTIRTLNLDRMAFEGIRLTSFYAAPSCSPSRAALLTGRYPVRSGISRVLGPDSDRGLPPSEVTLAERLKSRNYRTVAIGKWHLGTEEEYLPTSNGFDEYFGLLYSNDMQPPWVQTERPLKLYRNSEPVGYPVNQATLTERYTEEAIKFIRDAQDQPFFLYLPYTMPHVPISVSERFAGQSRNGLYGDVIETIDWSVGQILQALKQEGLDENTLVVFTSDNGPWLNMPERMFGEGIVKPWHAGSPGPLRGWKGTTYEGGMRVPFIARWPNRIPAGQTSAEPTSVMDLYATFLSLAGAQIPQDRPVDGRDITPLLTEGAASPHQALYYFSGELLEGVREGPWKLRIARDSALELFNLEVDPSERYNLAGQNPEIVTRLRSRMEAFAEELP
ncbi:MAG: sulfatase family protein [Acidobacteriota bacterium]